MILYMNHGHLEIRPSWLGKFTTLLQGLYLLLVLFSIVTAKGVAVLPYLLALTMAATVLSGLHYIHRGVRSFNGNG
jgi:phosphatidylglycerophosphate synthase